MPVFKEMIFLKAIVLIIIFELSVLTGREANQLIQELSYISSSHKKRALLITDTSLLASDHDFTFFSSRIKRGWDFRVLYFKDPFSSRNLKSIQSIIKKFRPQRVYSMAHQASEGRERKRLLDQRRWYHQMETYQLLNGPWENLREYFSLTSFDLLEKASKAHSMGDDEAFLEALRRIKQRKISNRWAYYAEGIYWAHRGNKEKSSLCFQKALGLPAKSLGPESFHIVDRAYDLLKVSWAQEKMLELETLEFLLLQRKWNLKNISKVELCKKVQNRKIYPWDRDLWKLVVDTQLKDCPVSLPLYPGLNKGLKLFSNIVKKAKADHILIQYPHLQLKDLLSITPQAYISRVLIPFKFFSKYPVDEVFKGDISDGHMKKKGIEIFVKIIKNDLALLE